MFSIYSFLFQLSLRRTKLKVRVVALYNVLLNEPCLPSLIPTKTELQAAILKVHLVSVGIQQLIHQITMIVFIF